MSKRLFHSFISIFFLSGFVILAIGVYIWWLTRDLPDVKQLSYYQPPLASRAYTANGEFLAEWATERRYRLNLSDISTETIRAFLAMEDRDFYQHFGLDFSGMIRAIWNNLTTSHPLQGASTITQQVAKRLLLSDEYGFSRKIREAILALEMERHLTKGQILTLYLNMLYFGNGAYGLESAAQTYFGKDAGSLTLAEGALLAGLPNAPPELNALTDETGALKRRNIVLTAMLDAKYISKETAWQTIRSPLNLMPPPSSPPLAPYYRDEVRHQLSGLFDETTQTHGGFTITTPLDRALQTLATQSLMEGLRAISPPDHPMDNPDMDGAILVMEVPTGRVLALTGGYDYQESVMNRASDMPRSPGSAFAPFITLTALEAGFSPASLLTETPVELRNIRGHSLWSAAPANPITATIRSALTTSNRLLMVHLGLQVGIPLIDALSRHLGLYDTPETSPALLLGGRGATLLTLTTAYATLANRGIPIQPAFIDTVVDANGNLLYQTQQENAPPLISEESAYQLTHILQKDGIARIYGTGDNAEESWFFAYTPEVIVGVFVGYDHPRSLGSQQDALRVAAPIGETFLKQALAEKLTTPAIFPVPPTVQFTWIDRNTGYLPSEHTAPENRILEAFRPEQAPKRAAESGEFLSILNQPATRWKNHLHRINHPIIRGTGGTY